VVSDPQKPMRRQTAGEFAGNRSGQHAEQERFPADLESSGLRVPGGAVGEEGARFCTHQAGQRSIAPSTAPAATSPS